MTSADASGLLPSTEHWQAACAIVDEALTRDMASRDAFVSDACGGDPVLTGAVARWLAAIETPSAFLAQSPLDSPPSRRSSPGHRTT